MPRRRWRSRLAKRSCRRNATGGRISRPISSSLGSESQHHRQARRGRAHGSPRGVWPTRARAHAGKPNGSPPAAVIRRRQIRRPPCRAWRSRTCACRLVSRRRPARRGLPLSARQPLVLPSKLPPNQRGTEIGLARGAKPEAEKEGDLSSRPRTAPTTSSAEPAGPYKLGSPPRPSWRSRHFGSSA